MKRVFVDIDRCIACRTCSAACNYRNNEFRSTIGYGDLRENVRLPFICRHCDEPSCLAACPKDAIKKLDNGVIKRMNMLCIGCKSCALACPFGVIEPEVRSYIITKCDLCASRLKEEKEPACVLACPAGALTFEEAEEVSEKRILVGSSISGHHPLFRRV
jgi:Fe-S-cluster-containing dehydrogenase component